MWDSTFSCDSKNLVSCRSERRDAQNRLVGSYVSTMGSAIGSSDSALHRTREDSGVRGSVRAILFCLIYKHSKTAYRNHRHRYSSRSHCSPSPSSPAIPPSPSPYRAATPPFAPASSDTTATLTLSFHLYHVNIVRFGRDRLLDRFQLSITIHPHRYVQIRKTAQQGLDVIHDLRVRRIRRGAVLQVLDDRVDAVFDPSQRDHFVVDLVVN